MDDLDAQIAALQAQRAARAQEMGGMEDVKSMFAQIVATQAKIESRLDEIEGEGGGAAAGADVLEGCATSLRDTAEGMSGQRRAIEQRVEEGEASARAAVRRSAAQVGGQV